MHIRTIGLAAAALCAFSSAPANAEMDGTEILERIDKGSMADQIALISYKVAYDWANSRLQFEKKEPFFCAPPKLSMTPDQTIDIFREQVKKNMAAAKTPAGLVMLYALTDTFPCDKKAQGKQP